MVNMTFSEVEHVPDSPQAPMTTSSSPSHEDIGNTEEVSDLSSVVASDTHAAAVWYHGIHAVSENEVSGSKPRLRAALGCASCRVQHSIMTILVLRRPMNAFVNILKSSAFYRLHSNSIDCMIVETHHAYIGNMKFGTLSCAVAYANRLSTRQRSSLMPRRRKRSRKRHTCKHHLQRVRRQAIVVMEQVPWVKFSPNILQTSR